MYIESVKLSPKKGGNGYLSSFTFNIGSKEAAACGLVGKRTIKIVDESKGTITFKAKRFTVTSKIVYDVIRLHEAERAEDALINYKYLSNKMTDPPPYSKEPTINMRKLLQDEYEGKIVRPKRDKLKNYLLNLPIETLADLVLLMYIGSNSDVDMEKEPGEDRFLDYYDSCSYTVVGSDPETLISILIGKNSISEFLVTGLQLLNAPKGLAVDEMMDEKKYYN